MKVNQNKEQNSKFKIIWAFGHLQKFVLHTIKGQGLKQNAHFYYAYSADFTTKLKISKFQNLFLREG